MLPQRRPENASSRRVRIWVATVAMGSAAEKSRKPKRRLSKVPKYEEPNTFPAAGLTGSAGGAYGSRDGHSADHHGEQKQPGRFVLFVLRFLGMKPKD